MKNKVIIILIIMVVVIIGGFIYNTFNETVEPDTEMGNAKPAEEILSVWVEVAQAVTGNIITYISETGVTVPLKSVIVSAETAGRIVQMDVEIGNFVQKGDTIAFVDDELARLALDQAKAQLINATAAYEKAKKDIQRYQVLLKSEEISESEFENVRVQHELARSAFLSADAAVKSAQRQLRNTRITTPISGQVAEKNAQTGNMISINQPVVKVVDLSKIKVNINISEQDIGKIRKNIPVTVLADAFQGFEFKGSVFTLSPEANLASHTFPVEIIVPNDQQKTLKSGMVVRVDIQKDVRENVVLIYRDAVIERFGKNIVYVINGQYAEERSIELGPDKEEQVQVISGIRTGEYVVIVGQYNLEDGSPVRIK